MFKDIQYIILQEALVESTAKTEVVIAKKGIKFFLKSQVSLTTAQPTAYF